MPAFIIPYRCDGCGDCVKICPSCIIHIDNKTRKAYNIEPQMCWECYPCVKACPQDAIAIRGYSDFIPLGAKLHPKRDTKTNTITWDVQFKNGRKLKFTFPIRTTPWGSIKAPQDIPLSPSEDLNSLLLASELQYLGTKILPTPNKT